MQVFDHTFTEDRGLSRGHKLEQSGKEHGAAGIGGAHSSPATVAGSHSELASLRHGDAPVYEHGTIAWAGLSGARFL